VWQIYDYVSVQSVHNATFARDLPPTFLQQARDLANWHEYHVFSSPNPKSIGTSLYRTWISLYSTLTAAILVAARTLAPSFTEYIKRIVNSSDPLKFAYTASSYKPFVSLFNVTGVAQATNSLAGVGECPLGCHQACVDLSSSGLYWINRTRSPYIAWNWLFYPVQL